MQFPGKGIWLFVFADSQFSSHGDLAQKVASLGVRRIFIKIAEGSNLSLFSDQNTAAVAHEYSTRGVEPWAWSYNYPGSEVQQAEALTHAVRNDFKGFVLDIEKEFDNNREGLRRLLQAFSARRPAGATFPMGATTWGNPTDHHMAIDVMDSFVDFHMPQTYLEAWGGKYMCEPEKWIDAGNDEYRAMGATKPVLHILNAEKGVITTDTVNRFLAHAGTGSSLFRIPGGCVPMSNWKLLEAAAWCPPVAVAAGAPTVAAVAPATAPPSPDIQPEEVSTSTGRFWILKPRAGEVVRPAVAPLSARDYLKSFPRIVGLVNGTFFTESSRADRVSPLGDILTDIGLCTGIALRDFNEQPGAGGKKFWQPALEVSKPGYGNRWAMVESSDGSVSLVQGQPSSLSKFKASRWVIGGGAALVRNGERVRPLNLDLAENGALPDPGRKTSRAYLAATAENVVHLVVNAGVLSPEEAAQGLVELGYKQVLMLDGGGAATLLFRTAGGGTESRVEHDLARYPRLPTVVAIVQDAAMAMAGDGAPRPTVPAVAPSRVPNTGSRVAPERSAEYLGLYRGCVIRPEKAALVDGIIDAIQVGRAEYKGVGEALGVPWYVIAIIHSLESSLRFDRHLHNGDPLTGRTVHEPKGRPTTGSPPFTWVASATDALKSHGFHQWEDWSVPGILFKLEEYNGTGYRHLSRRINSPYLWSFSNQYSKGKFVADSAYSADAVSQQCGAAVLLLRMQQKGLIALEEASLSMAAVVSAPRIRFSNTESPEAGLLQGFLNSLGFQLDVDGKPGRDTSEAMQQVFGFRLDGDPQADAPGDGRVAAVPPSVPGRPSPLLAAETATGLRLRAPSGVEFDVVDGVALPEASSMRPGMKLRTGDLLPRLYIVCRSAEAFDLLLTPHFVLREFISTEEIGNGIRFPYFVPAAIVRLAAAVEGLRAAMGGNPMVLSSGFRSPFHSMYLQDPGKASTHRFGTAVDIVRAGELDASQALLDRVYAAAFDHPTPGVRPSGASPLGFEYAESLAEMNGIPDHAHIDMGFISGLKDEKSFLGRLLL